MSSKRDRKREQFSSLDTTGGSSFPNNEVVVHKLTGIPYDEQCRSKKFKTKQKCGENMMCTCFTDLLQQHNSKAS